MLQRILFLLALALAGALSAGDVAATLLKTSGEGHLYLPDGREGAYKAGTLVQPGSRIVTSEGGLAVLMMDDGSRVSLGPNTDLTLSESKADAGVRSTVFDLVKGLFKATVEKLTVGSRFEVKTADAVAAVKGTNFAVLLDGQGTRAEVEEGTVWLQNARGERAVLKARMRGFAERGGRIRDVRPMTREELRNFRQWARASLAPHSGKLLPADQAKREAWARLRPEQRRQVARDLAESLGDTWDDIVGLRDEERQERWRDRLRQADERRLATEGARVDFALGKTALDRQGRRVRFDEYLLRPAANKVQFLNYTRRGERTDLVSSINTYNRALPQNLGDAAGMNQRVWVQGLGNAPRYWVVDSALVAGNSSGDSFAASTGFYDPYFRGLYWELPIKDTEIRLNIPDLQQPRVGGEVVEHWVRQVTVNGGSLGTIVSPVAGLTPVPGASSTSQPLRSVNGTSNNLADLDRTNLVWALGDANSLPTTTLLGPGALEAKPGDLAFGFRRNYKVFKDGTGIQTVNAASPLTLEFRNYVINENGEIVNLAGIDPDKLMQEFVNRRLIASLKQIEIRSSRFKEGDGINVVSKLLFLHDLSKTQDQL